MTSWTDCPDCDDSWCNIHGMHVSECECPPIDEWAVDPFEEVLADDSQIALMIRIREALHECYTRAGKWDDGEFILSLAAQECLHEFKINTDSVVINPALPGVWAGYRIH